LWTVLPVVSAISAIAPSNGPQITARISLRWPS
jgi:hypothetical protein